MTANPEIYKKHAIEDVIVWLAKIRHAALKNRYQESQATTSGNHADIRQYFTVATANSNSGRWETLYKLAESSLGQINWLWQNYAKQGLPPYIYLSNFQSVRPSLVLPTDITRLCYELSEVMQFERRQLVQNLQGIFESASDNENAAPDPEKFQTLAAALETSTIGSYALQNIRQIGTNFLFIPETDPSISRKTLGTYQSANKTVRIFWPGNKNIDRLSVVTVHEARHAVQDHHTPEIFSQDLSDIDKFIATKLKEADACALHNLFLHEKEATRPLSDETYLSDQEVLNEIGLPKIKACEEQGKNWSVLKLLMLHNFMYMLDQPKLWTQYESSLLTENVMSAVLSGTWQKKVQESQFLQPDFLTRFCVSPDGDTYLPVNSQSLIDEIAEKIAKIHTPMPTGLKAAIHPSILELQF